MYGMIPNNLPNFFLEYETQYFTLNSVLICRSIKRNKINNLSNRVLNFRYHKYCTDDHIIQVKRII